MYCSGCGHAVAFSQPVCPHCGRPMVMAFSGVPGVPVYPAVPYRTKDAFRVQRHVQTVGILWIVFAIWSLLQWALAVAFFAGIFHHHTGMMHQPFGDGFPFHHSNLPWWIPLVTVVTLARAALSLVTGMGLMRRAPWARILALVTAFTNILNLITGTILAIYTLWVLLPSASAYEYEQLSHEAATT